MIEKIKALCKSEIDPDTANSDGTHWVDTFATHIIWDLDLDDRSGFEKPEDREEIYLIGDAD